MSAQMLWAVIRPDKKHRVVAELAAQGFHALSMIQVFGRGQQRGIQVGAVAYDELAKTLLVIAVEGERCEQAVRIIQQAAHTGGPGDGKIFVQPVAQVLTVRTGAQQL